MVMKTGNIVSNIHINLNKGLFFITNSIAHQSFMFLIQNPFILQCYQKALALKA